MQKRSAPYPRTRSDESRRSAPRSGPAFPRAVLPTESEAVGVVQDSFTLGPPEGAGSSIDALARRRMTANSLAPFLRWAGASRSGRPGALQHGAGHRVRQTPLPASPSPTWAATDLPSCSPASGANAVLQSWREWASRGGGVDLATGRPDGHKAAQHRRLGPGDVASEMVIHFLLRRGVAQANADGTVNSMTNNTAPRQAGDARLHLHRMRPQGQVQLRMRLARAS